MGGDPAIVDRRRIRIDRIGAVARGGHDVTSSPPVPDIGRMTPAPSHI
jgi:hypothetical protein